jgi:endoglycosylceramidase
MEHVSRRHATVGCIGGAEVTAMPKPMLRLRRSIRRITAVATLSSTLILASGADAVRPLALSGGELRDRAGREVVLHGVNVVYKVPPYHPNNLHGLTSNFTRRDARRLERWGLNNIRLGVTWAGLAPERGKVDGGYIARLERIVRLAERHGLYVLIDMHQDGWSAKYGGNGAPDWANYDDNLPWVPGLGHPAEYGNPAVGRAFTSFWQNRAGIRTEYVKAFAALARELRDRPGVFGYDTFNEPSCEYTRDPCAFPPPPHAAGELLHPFYEEIIPALQRADPTAAVFYEDWITASSGEYSVGEFPNPPLEHDGHLGLSYHVYCASGDCEQGDAQTIAHADRNARANDAFPLITEFGATDDPPTIERVANLADEAGHSWQYWTYKTYFDPYPIFLIPPDVARATDRDDTWSIIAEDGTVKRRKVEALARPYPMALAGRKGRWSFDPQSKVFELRFVATSNRSSIVAFPARIQYPRGFAITARGARVTPRPARSRLLLSPAEKGAKVRLVVRPGGRGPSRG